jgi:hypothetical protein
MGTGKCTDVLVLLPPSSANNAAPKSVKVKSNIKAAINQAALTCNECHAVRVRICRVLNGGHWRLLRALYDRRGPVQAEEGECERGSTTNQDARVRRQSKMQRAGAPVIASRASGARGRSFLARALAHGERGWQRARLTRRWACNHRLQNEREQLVLTTNTTVASSNRL